MTKRKLGPIPSKRTTSAFLLFVLASLQGCNDKPSNANSLESYIDSNRSTSHTGSTAYYPYGSTTSSTTHATTSSASKSSGFFASSSSSSSAAHGSSSSGG